MALIFYTNPTSRGRMVRWALEEIGQPYETKIIPYGPEMKSPDYLAINPMGKVPALTHDHTVITETAAIIAYLADAFPEADLAPTPGTRERGPYYRWLFFAAGPFEAAVMDKALGLHIPPARKASIGYGSLEEVLDTLEAALTPGPYLLGDSFSAADIYVGSQLGHCMRFGAIPPRPAFETYVHHLQARPAALRATALDDATTI